ncbi:MAG: pirin family protein [Candidatus Neomarinimicrobiota bacterium]
MNTKTRNISHLIEGIATQDGAGVNLTRIIGSPELNMLDPFLLLDEFGSENPNDYIAGFPPHPHRGFETITYMLNGKFTHKDSAGNEGHLSDGGVQWMTAGKGVVHSEMPEQSEGLMRGFQLWLNLPKEKKMIDPSYHDIQADKIPLVSLENAKVKVISGKFQSTKGPGRPHTGVLYLDVHLNEASGISIPINENWNAFIYVYEGEIESNLSVPKGNLAVLDTDGIFECRSISSDTKFILAAGEPINEPVARGGPFVMNTKGEVLKAFDDYQSGKLG